MRLSTLLLLLACRSGTVILDPPPTAGDTSAPKDTGDTGKDTGIRPTDDSEATGDSAEDSDSPDDSNAVETGTPGDSGHTGESGETGEPPSDIVSGSCACPINRDCDDDGYTDEEGDCDPCDTHVNPDVDDMTADGVDQDCDGIDGPHEEPPP